jgi:hypothetical protein
MNKYSVFIEIRGIDTTKRFKVETYAENKSEAEDNILKIHKVVLMEGEEPDINSNNSFMDSEEVERLKGFLGMK